MPSSLCSLPFCWSDRRALDVLLLDLDTYGAQALEVRDGTVRAMRHGVPLALPFALPAAPSDEVLGALAVQWSEDDGRLDATVVRHRLAQRRAIALGRTLVLDRFRRLRFRMNLCPSGFGDGWSLNVRWMPLFPQSLKNLGLSPLLLQRLSTLPHQGLVVLGGEVGTGATTLLNASVQHWACTIRDDRDAGRRPRAGLVSRRHEQWFAGEYPNILAGTVLQSSPQDPDGSMADSLNWALRTNLDLIALDDVQDREAWGWLIRGAESGHLTLGTTYAAEGLVALFRRLRGLSGSGDARVSMLHALRLLVWQGWVDTPDGRRVRVQEHLVLDGAVRAEIEAASRVRLNTVLHEAMVQQGSDRVSDARARWERGLLDEATLDAVVASVPH